MYEGMFRTTKPEALAWRRILKAKGHCSCIVKLRSGQGWFVQDCPSQLCKKSGSDKT